MSSEKSVIDPKNWAPDSYVEKHSRDDKEPSHNDHPARHWDRTCPACIAERHDAIVDGDLAAQRAIHERATNTRIEAEAEVIFESDHHRQEVQKYFERLVSSYASMRYRTDTSQEIACILNDAINLAKGAQRLFSSTSFPKSNDGKEQEAFEAWAKAEGYDMEQHPLHWLFLHPKTYSARDGWRAALEYVARVSSATSFRQVGQVHHAMANDGKCGPYFWTENVGALADGTGLFVPDRIVPKA